MLVKGYKVSVMQVEYILKYSMETTANNTADSTSNAHTQKMKW